MPGLCVPFGHLKLFLWKGFPHAKTKQNTKGKHYSGLLITFTCSFLFVVVIGCRAEVYIVKICNKIRVHDWEHIYFYAPTSGPVKSKPHILPDHKVWTETSQSQPVQEKSVLFVFVKMLTTWHNKGRVRNSVQDIDAAVVACVVCVYMWDRLSRDNEIRERFCLPTWLRVLCDFCSHTLHWSYSLIDMPLQPYACLRTQPKNCLSSRRRVEFCSPGLGSHEPLCSRSGRRKEGGGGRGRRGERQRREGGEEDEKTAPRLQLGQVLVQGGV